MKRKHIIVLQAPSKNPILRGNFKKLCKEFGLPYHSIKNEKFPMFMEKISVKNIPEDLKNSVIYKEPFL